MHLPLLFLTSQILRYYYRTHKKISWSNCCICGDDSAHSEWYCKTHFHMANITPQWPSWRGAVIWLRSRDWHSRAVIFHHELSRDDPLLVLGSVCIRSVCHAFLFSSNKGSSSTRPSSFRRLYATTAYLLRETTLTKQQRKPLSFTQDKRETSLFFNPLSKATKERTSKIVEQQLGRRLDLPITNI